MGILSSARVQRRIKSLFCLYLFVAQTLGNCPIPELKDNIVLSNEALLLNEYVDNIEITLTCVNGYVRDSGTATMKCTDGAWSEPDITCKKKDCGPPPQQPHMIYNTSQGTLFGDVAVVMCEKGYSVKGSSFKHCYNAGWTGRSTKCERISCDMPGAIANGNNSWTSDSHPKYGDRIFFSCDKGYTITGKGNINCNEEGQYDSTPPICVGQDTVRETDNTPTTKTSTMPYLSKEDSKTDIVNTKTAVGYTPVIISVMCVTLAACIAILFIHRLLNKRKGSYDTREDLKPELLQFQNL